MDRSFEGLLASIIIHILLVVALLNAKVPAPAEIPTEVTLVEKPQHGKEIVNFENKKQNLDLNDLKRKTDYLADQANRVKKETQAMKLADKTVNAAKELSLQPHLQPQDMQPRNVGGRSQPKTLEDGETEKSVKLPQQQLRPITIGESTSNFLIPGVAGSFATSLNTDQFTYSAFYRRMGEQFHYRWGQNISNYESSLSQQKLQVLSSRDRTTVVEVVLTPTGQWKSGAVMYSCGDKGLDDAALRAFKEAAPFPNPPKGMIQADGLIHANWQLTVVYRPLGFGPAG